MGKTKPVLTEHNVYFSLSHTTVSELQFLPLRPGAPLLPGIPKGPGGPGGPIIPISPLAPLENIS